MKISSPAFAPNGSIPAKYTCQGKGINPPLRFENTPPNTKSLVLILDDPDVPPSVRPDCMFDHWVIYNIPPSTRSIEENSTPPGVQGKNTNGQSSYFGPCPPDREHRYFFKLYALDTLLDLPPGATKKQVEAAMQNHILAKAELIGLYKKS